MAQSLGQALRFARKKAKLTLVEAARALGVTHQAVSMWEKDDNHPSMANLIRACELYGVDVGAITNGDVRISTTQDIRTREPFSYIDDRRKDDGEPREYREAQVEHHRGNLVRDVPVYGIAVGGDDADFTFNGEEVEYVRRPPGIVGVRSVYALFVANDSMVPRFRPGELIYALASRPPQVGDDVVVELKSHDDREHGGGYVKRLKAFRGTKVVVEQFNPPLDIEFDAHEIKQIHRILTTNELFGV
jgi:phage repressor protein C with HTH and peptisase S24 domain